MAWLLLWNAYILIWNKGIPIFVQRPPFAGGLSLCCADRAARSGQPYTIIDLGAGNGLFTRQIARALPDAQVIGIEISALAFRWAEIFRRWSGLKNLEYRRADFNDVHLGTADAVVMFPHIYFMESMGKKLHAELKPGALATSTKFALRDGWTPQQTLDVATFYPHQKTLYVYRQS